MRDDHHDLSPAGARRRDRMLPLLQDAVRARGERRRRRRTLACGLLLFTATVGLVQLMQQRTAAREESDSRLVVGETVGPNDAVPSVESTTLDIRPIGPSRMYARLRAADPEVSIQTPDSLPDSLRIRTNTVVVERITTEELMDQLASAGYDHAVICSEVECRLFLAKTDPARTEEDGRDRVRGT